MPPLTLSALRPDKGSYWRPVKRHAGAGFSHRGGGAGASLKLSISKLYGQRGRGTCQYPFVTGPLTAGHSPSIRGSLSNMIKRGNRAVDEAASTLRAAAMALADGDFLGTEDILVERFRFSRNTLRQVARLLEREGLLRTKRGAGGGYYAARPNSATIQAAIGVYMDSVDVDPADIASASSSLWLQVVRKAASASHPRKAEICNEIRKQLKNIKDDESFQNVVSLEFEIRESMFEISKSSYLKLLFNINVSFARKYYKSIARNVLHDSGDGFSGRWRDIKLMEIDSIARGETGLAIIVAQHLRTLWDERILASSPPNDFS